MELHPLNVWVRFVLYRHDGAVFAPCRDLELVGTRRSIYDQTMISRCFKWVFQPSQQPRIRVKDGRRLAVHHPAGRSDDPPTEDLAYALMAHAHAEYWEALGTEFLDDFERDSRIFRSSWTRGYQDASRVHGLDLFYGFCIVWEHDVLAAEIAEVLAKIIGKAVVVVDHNDGAFAVVRRGGGGGGGGQGGRAASGIRAVAALRV
jgi:hypothetical protein